MILQLKILILNIKVPLLYWCFKLNIKRSKYIKAYAEIKKNGEKMKINTLFIKTFLLISLVCGYVNAADIIIKNAQVFDGTGSDLIKNASVIIEDGKVKALR